ncbi:DUF5305 domain-containing protein [Haloarcula amylolytica]|uniref:DUF5305 domain-containing protein n=1 Tax=Haloarcula amylolytica TaxID=396317 RepID=UPI003C7889E1
MSERRTRARILLTDNFELVVLALLVVAGIGAFVTYTTHIEPGTTTEERQVSSWESTGEFFHRATVQNDTEVYAQGTVLHNQSVYFQQLTPELDGVFAYEYTASDGGNLSVETDITLRLQSVQADTEGNGTVYWETQDRLAADTEAGVGPGGRVSVPFRVNVTDAGRRLAAIDEQFGGTPGEKQALLVAEVTVSGTRNGSPVDRTRTYQLPLNSQGSVYRVDDPGAVVASDSRTDQVSVPAEYGPLRLAGGPFLFLLGLTGLSAVGYYHRNAPPLTETERTWYDHRQTRAEFDEWITTGRVPEELSERPVVTTASLSGLVDVAIDTGERVIEDEDRSAYFVLGESQWYRYEMPPQPERSDEQSSKDDDNSGSQTDEDDGETPSDILDASAPTRDR